MIKLPTFINHYVYCLTGFEYTHFTLSLCKNSKNSYSFQRRNKNLPLVGGPLCESEVFYFNGKKNKNVKIIEYEVPVTDDEYRRICGFVDKIFNDKEYMFSFISVWLTFPFGGIKSYKSYQCTEFICEILSLIDNISLPKESHKMRPLDLYKVLKEYNYKEKTIHSNNYVIQNDNMFFKKIKFSVALRKSIYSIKESFYRTFFYKASKRFDFRKINFYAKDIKKDFKKK